LYWHTFSNTGCFSTISSTLEVNGFSEKFLFVIRLFVTVFKTAQQLRVLSIPDYSTDSWSLIYIFSPVYV